MPPRPSAAQLAADREAEAHQDGGADDDDVDDSTLYEQYRCVRAPRRTCLVPQACAALAMPALQRAAALRHALRWPAQSRTAAVPPCSQRLQPLSHHAACLLPCAGRPAKVQEGLPHPDPIVETATLASVSPPDITYQHHLQVWHTTRVYVRVRARHRL
jgi:hypothetical protein